MFAVFCRDGENKQDDRALHRSRHIEYVKSTSQFLRAAGPLCVPGRPNSGGLFILDVPTLADARHWVEGDPFLKEGVYSRVEVLQWSLPGDVPILADKVSTNQVGKK